MTDEFEAQVSRAFRNSPEADPVEVDSLRRYAAGLSARPRQRVHPAMLVTGAATAVLVMAVVVVGLMWFAPTNAGGNLPPYPINRTDPRFAKCAGSLNDVLAAFPMEHAKDYRAYLPKMGLSPELDTSESAFVVVYVGQYPGGILPGLGPSGQSYTRPTPAPNHHDLCIWVGDLQAGTSNVYADVDITGMSATPSSTPSAEPASSAVLVPITGPATWTHDPAAEIGPNTIEFTAWVTETDCASGQSSEGRIVGPDIRVSPAAVVVTFRVRKRSLFGAEECPSNPATPVVVHLPEPLGDRPLLDGGREPPAEPPVCGNRNSCE